jgi:hypothetical protein
VSISAHEDYFVRHGVLGAGSSSEAARYILEIQPSLNSAPYESPSKYVSWLIQSCERAGAPTTLNGGIFELALACVLLKEGLAPFYMSAQVMFVPNARFDLMLYTAEVGPIVLSAKTSLRERYKQADLESQALRDVHRRSKTFLITLGEKEAAGVRKKIESGDVTNLDDVILADKPEFDLFINSLKDYELIPGPIFPAVHEGRLITLS